MATQNNNVYKIKIENRHLKNILEENYYIELGTISIKKMNRFLKGQLFDIADICYYDIAVEGVGKITTDRENDLEFQMMYLLKMRQKSSSNKIFLTCNILKYYDLRGCEIFAPIVLIPVDIDIREGKIIKTGSPVINNVLISELQVIKKEAISVNDRLTTLEQINTITFDLAKKTGYEYRIGNYLTFAAINYQDKMSDIDENYFDTQRSIHELTAKQIRDDFFAEIKAVLPTNITQKYVLLKSSNNENFFVLGRFGSGKTYTALNIVADKVAKGKKVLYVNQDMDNIDDFFYSLSQLQLDKYVFNFCDFVRDGNYERYQNTNIIIPKFENEEITIDLLKDIEDFENVFNLRLHGFRYQTIANQLAIIKNTEKQLIDLIVEPQLQNNEVWDIYNRLLDIEENLKLIVPLKENVWRNLESFYTINNVREIEQALYNYTEEQTKINQIIKQFAHKYQLTLPDSMRDFHRIVNILRNFVTHEPPFSWSDTDNFNNAKTANERLLKNKISIVELEKAYKQLVKNNYQLGLAEEIINMMLQAKSLRQEEATYNKLLTFENELIYQLPQIEYHYDLFVNKHKKVYNYFGLSENDDIIYKYSCEIEELLSHNAINKNWFNLYSNNQRLCLTNNEIILGFIEEIHQLAKTIEPYLAKNGTLKYADIKANYQSSRFYQQILTILNLKKIKTDRKSPEDITRIFFDYAQKINTLIEKLEHFKIHYFDDIEEFMDVYSIWAKYASQMTVPQQKLIERLLKNAKNIKGVISREYYQNIADFNYECDVFNQIVVNLGNVGILVEGPNILVKARNCQIQMSFLKRLSSLFNQFAKQYKLGTTFTYADLQLIKNIDHEYYHQQKILKENDSYYREIFGKVYRGIDTDCNEIYALIFSFKQFKDRIVVGREDYIKDIMTPSMLTQLLSEYKIINTQYEKFYETHRQLGRYFAGGVSFLLECPLDEALKNLKALISHINELPHILTIIAHLNHFKKMGLSDIIVGIKDSRYVEKVAVSYLYVTLSQYYHQAKEENPQLRRDYAALEWLENYNLFERNYCTNNINDLIKENDTNERKVAGRLNNVEFNDYNQIVIQEERHKQIYLANIDIFNSDLDLSSFDLVIIDDCHIGSVNKYHRLFECRQVIAFGDDSFRYNPTTSLMNKFSRKNKIYFTKRYLRLSSRFSNEWHIKDQYVYLFQPKIDIVDAENFVSFIKYIYNYYQKDRTAVINIIILSHSVKRRIFKDLVIRLRQTYTVNEIKEIMRKHIRIIIANAEAASVATDVVFYYDDLNVLEGPRLINTYRNYASVTNRISIVYIKKTKKPEEIINVKRRISDIIGRFTVYQKENTGIISIVIDALAKRQIEATPGFGRFDIVIHSAKMDTNVGIIIEGNENIMPYSLIDDYQYYYGQYTKYGWQVFVFYIEDLIDHLEEKLTEVELALAQAKHSLN